MLNIPHRIYKAFASQSISQVRPNTGLYPASASIKIKDTQYGSCHRQEYYRWYRYEPTSVVDPEGVLTTTLGDSIHRMVAELLRNNVHETDIVVLSEEQAFFDSTEFISGRIDLFLKDLKTGLLHGCDVKSVGEYKAGMVIDQPDIQHILQCAVYLDQYNKSAKLNNSKPVQDWIVLYIARNESWKLKKYPHGSVFKYMWQFSIDLEKGYVTVTSQSGSRKEYPEITIEKIYEQYRILMSKIKSKTLPDRDFQIQYSEERITGMYKSDQLNKTNGAIVEKWLEKGAKAGELKLDIGDFQCKFCQWSALCYSETPDAFANAKKQIQALYNIPKDIILVTELKEAKENIDLI